MLKPISVALVVSLAGLAGCAPSTTPDPVVEQYYDGGHSGSGSYVARSSNRCPNWANVIHRGDLYCLKNR